MTDSWQESHQDAENQPAINEEADADATAPSHRVRVEEVEDEEAPRYAQPFPDDACAGQVYGSAKTMFDIIRDDQVLQGAEVWGPFRNDDEWQLAKWLIKNVGHNQAEEFLKLGLVSTVIYTNNQGARLRLDRFATHHLHIPTKISSTTRSTTFQRGLSGTAKK